MKMIGVKIKCWWESLTFEGQLVFGLVVPVSIYFIIALLTMMWAI